MALFENRYVSFEVPDDWTDETTAQWVEPPPPAGLPATITLTRTATSADDTLENRTVSALRQMTDVPGFTLIEKNPFKLADETAAMQLLVEWTHPAGNVMELISLFVRRGTFWIFTATLPSDRLEDLDPIMQHVLGSFTVVPAPAPPT